MAKKENVYPFTDILHHAEKKLKIKWNKAHDLLNNIRPIYESKTYEVYLEDLNKDETGLSKEAIDILKSFMKSEKIKYMNIIDD